jgi:hypothetical protein
MSCLELYGLTNFTPFKLLYGEKAVIPEEVKLGSLRTDQEPQNKEDTNLAIDRREEDMLQVLSNIEKYQDEMRRWRNKKVHEQKISTGDMVLPRKTRGIGKLEEKWEGPFLVSETRQVAYRLQTLEGEEVPYSWNQHKLQKYWL